MPAGDGIPKQQKEMLQTINGMETKCSFRSVRSSVVFDFRKLICLVRCWLHGPLGIGGQLNNARCRARRSRGCFSCLGLDWCSKYVSTATVKPLSGPARKSHSIWFGFRLAQLRGSCFPALAARTLGLQLVYIYPEVFGPDNAYCCLRNPVIEMQWLTRCKWSLA